LTTKFYYQTTRVSTNYKTKESNFLPLSETAFYTVDIYWKVFQFSFCQMACHFLGSIV